MHNKIRIVNKRAQIGMLKGMNSSRRGQIGETMTWIVATIIIIVILAISIFMASDFLGGNKSISASRTSDILASKSLFSYVLTKDMNETNVFVQIQEEENLNEFNGDLSVRIFEESYGEEYGKVWLGLRGISAGYKNSNDYFGDFPLRVKGEDTGLGSTSIRGILETIKLSEEKYLQLYLTASN